MASLITPTELIVYLDLPPDSQPTDRAQLVCDMASAAVRAACGWQISEVTGQTFVAAATRGLIWLPTRYLTAVTSVTIGGYLLSPADYTWTASGQILPTWWFTAGSAVVVATHGYPANAIPDDIKSACLRYAARLYHNPMGLRSETVGSVSSSYSEAGPSVHADPDLAPYRLAVVA